MKYAYCKWRLIDRRRPTKCNTDHVQMLTPPRSYVCCCMQTLARLNSGPRKMPRSLAFCVGSRLPHRRGRVGTCQNNSAQNNRLYDSVVQHYRLDYPIYLFFLCFLVHYRSVLACRIPGVLIDVFKTSAVVLYFGEHFLEFQYDNRRL